MRAISKSALLAAVFLAFFASEATAIYTPNPAARWEANRFFVAGDFQYNWDKDLDPRGQLDDEVGLFVRPSYALARNMVIYGRLGFQDADGLDTGFAIGGGFQAAWVLPQAPEWALGGSFDYLFWDAEAGSSDIDYHELQVAPAVSYNIPQAREITPYAGFALDFLAGDLEEDDPFGLFFGSNFDVSDRVRLDAQLRVIHEEGIFFSAGYLF